MYVDERDKDSIRTRLATCINNHRSITKQDNLSKSQRESKSNLAKNKDIMILPADKCRATVVVNTSDYNNRVQNMLSCENTYRKLDRDPTPKYKKQLV